MDEIDSHNPTNLEKKKSMIAKNVEKNMPYKIIT